MSFKTISKGPPSSERNAEASSVSVRYSGAYSKDPLAFPNTGIRTTINVIDLGPSMPSNSIPLVAWTAEETVNGNWAQFGPFYGNGSPLQWFYQVWQMSPQQVLTGGQGPLTPGLHTFTVMLSPPVSNTISTVWQFLLDGTVVGSFDMKAAVSAGPNAQEPIMSVVEQQIPAGSASYPIPQVSLPSALQTLVNGQWYTPLTGSMFNSAATYGTAGNLQDATIPNGQVNVGSQYPILSMGTALWKGSVPVPTPTPVPVPTPTPAPVTNSFSLSSSVSGGVVTTTATATDSMGKPVQGMQLTGSNSPIAQTDTQGATSFTTTVSKTSGKKKKPTE